jgi:hypothetical protein
MSLTIKYPPIQLVRIILITTAVLALPNTFATTVGMEAKKLGYRSAWTSSF